MKKIVSLLILLLMLTSILPTMAMGETAMTGSALSKAGGTLTDGNYYLASDTVVLDKTIVIDSGSNVTINLNGNVLMGSGTNFGPVIKVNPNATLTVIDTGSKEHKFSTTTDGLWVLNETSGNEVVTGGVITGGTGYKPDKVIYGGAVYNEGTLNIKGGNFVGNKVESLNNENSYGGAICNKGGYIDITGGVFSGNIAKATYSDEVFGRGGAIANQGGTLKISGDVLISYNTADEGGAIRSANSTADAYAYINGGTIKNNTALVNGGGIFIYRYGFAEITDTTITDNLGGGLYYENTTAATLKLGGKLIIKDNYHTNASGTDIAENFKIYHYKPEFKVIKEQPVLSTTNPLKPGSDISVTTDWTYGAITKNGTYEDLQYFSSDDDNYDVLFVNYYLSMALLRDVDSAKTAEKLVQSEFTKMVWNVTRDFELDREIVLYKNIRIKGNGHTITGSSEGDNHDHMFNFKSDEYVYNVEIEDLNLVGSGDFEHVLCLQISTSRDTSKHGLDGYLKNVSISQPDSKVDTGLALINNGCDIYTYGNFSVTAGEKSIQGINMDASKRAALLVLATDSNAKFTDKRNSNVKAVLPFITYDGENENSCTVERYGTDNIYYVATSTDEDNLKTKNGWDVIPEPVVVIEDNTPVVASAERIEKYGIPTVYIGEKRPEINILTLSSTYQSEEGSFSATAPIIIEQNRTFLGIRDMATVLGVAPEAIKWNDATKTATISKSGAVIAVTQGSNIIKLTYKGYIYNIENDVSAINKNDRIYLPFRVIFELFGYTVDWNSETRTISCK